MDLIERTLQQALRMLGAAKARYVVVTADGREFTAGGLTAKIPKGKKGKAPGAPRRMLGAIYLDKLRSLPVGEVARIQVPPDVMARDVRAAASAFGNKHWGNGSYTSAVDTEANTVDIFRVG